MIPLVLNNLNYYIVNYLRNLRKNKPLVSYEYILPILESIDAFMRYSIGKGFVGIGRDYCNFIKSFGDIMATYIEDDRLDDAPHLSIKILDKILIKDTSVINLQLIQQAIIEHPKIYDKLLPKYYDLLIDCSVASLCTFFEILQRKLPPNDIIKLDDILFHLTKHTVH